MNGQQASRWVRVVTIGGCEVVVNGKTIDPSAQLVFAAILLLALDHDRCLSRTSIAELLWPYASRSLRASRMRWLLSKLRRLDLTICVDAGGISLTGDSLVVDADDVAGIPLFAVDEILPGYHPAFSPAFAERVDAWRLRIAAALLDHLGPRLRAAKLQHDWPLVARVASAIRRVDALDEEATIAAAEAEYRLGSKASALATLQQYMSMTGDAGSPVVSELLRNMQRVRNAHPTVEPTFVGREDVLERVERLLGGCRIGRGGALVLAGPEGIGKSRLLEEAANRAMMIGMHVVRVDCSPGHAVRPSGFLSALGAKLLALPGALGCRPEHFELLHDLTYVPPMEQFAAALFDLLECLTAESPLLLAIDNLHWAGAAFAQIWSLIAAWNADRRAAWLFSAPTRLASSNIDAPVISLGPLDRRASSVLIDNLRTDRDRPLPIATRDALIARAGGNPLFIREFVRQWSSLATIDNVPYSLAALIENGLHAVGHDAIRILQAAAVLGGATLERMQNLVALDDGAFTAAIERLTGEAMLPPDLAGLGLGQTLWAEAALRRLPQVLHAHLRHQASMMDVRAPILDAGWPMRDVDGASVTV